MQLFNPTLKRISNRRVVTKNRMEVSHFPHPKGTEDVENCVKSIKGLTTSMVYFIRIIVAQSEFPVKND